MHVDTYHRLICLPHYNILDLFPLLYLKSSYYKAQAYQQAS
jgi:hypothetical protein